MNDGFWEQTESRRTTEMGTHSGPPASENTDTAVLGGSGRFWAILGGAVIRRALKGVSDPVQTSAVNKRLAAS
ncbi:hypothetical protein ROS1_42670 [Roseibium sp. ROS1]